MQSNPDQLYDQARRRQNELETLAMRERYSHLFPSHPVLDPAIWSAVLGTIIGVSFLVYFAREILSAVTG